MATAARRSTFLEDRGSTLEADVHAWGWVALVALLAACAIALGVSNAASGGMAVEPEVPVVSD